jgi:chloramphenicol-sensitive protein RarD
VQSRTEQSTQTREGMIAASLAFGFWGMVPLYFKALNEVGAGEIIAHRIIWSVPLLALFLLLRDGRQFFRRLVLPPKLILGLLLSGLLVSNNWLVYVYAVVTDQVMATSLGYFINPLVNVLLGFLFLHERLTRSQAFAVALAAAGTLYLGIYLGQPPWIALVLGFSFGFYGLVRKKLAVGPMTGLMWEVLLLMPLGLGFLLWLQAQGGISFLNLGLRTDMLLLLAGPVTVLPLIWFNMAAKKLPLTVLGFFQYTTPSLVFILAAFVWDEPFTQGHAVAFGCIWTALLILSVESVARMRRERRLRDASNG